MYFVSPLATAFWVEVHSIWTYLTNISTSIQPERGLLTWPIFYFVAHDIFA